MASLAVWCSENIESLWSGYSKSLVLSLLLLFYLLLWSLCERCVIAITLFANRNRGTDRHTLRCCDFAGWDSKEQFTLISKELTAQPQHPLAEKCPGSPEQQVPAPDTVDREDGSVPEEKMADILPGERLSVAIACLGKWVLSTKVFFFGFFFFFSFPKFKWNYFIYTRLLTVLTWRNCDYVFSRDRISVVYSTMMFQNFHCVVAVVVLSPPGTLGAAQSYSCCISHLSPLGGVWRSLWPVRKKYCCSRPSPTPQ